ncbi:hypothetical protein IU438_27185 [Nocardia cyriacigeorgica]|uniref:pPIWI_RE_Y domain-containing protein n=1 Tax=Nocardia cyriacigeorgica TaxID=135487 RepID=UPI001894B4D1|nr:hypothetical protein [Nocardia cyriacigeorgica]MBF6399459.1 hypothetical protein [Nocardia cyriacigeorgica]MBF6405089.1 hypothetical protein [Nocardia cyriacigeorgica]
MSGALTEHRDGGDLGLLRTIATAVIRLADATGPQALSVPYDSEAVRALNGTVLACLKLGAEPPASLPDLLLWCRTRPIEDWPLDLPEDAFGPDDRLIDEQSGEPTQLCHEWWVGGRDSAAAEFDRAVIRSAMKRCQEASSPESYSAFRRLLVTAPVLTSDKELEVATDLYLEPVRELLALAYAPAPLGYRRRGKFVTCGRCGTLLTPTLDEGWWCERDQCRSRGPAPLGRELSATGAGALLYLVRPLRHFVTGPGLAEIELERRLRAMHGLRVEMWPGYDAYDIRITFPDNHVWAVDVKDWAHPGLLGQAARPVQPEPPYDEAFWVVPQFRVDTRRDYLGIFARHRAARAGNLPLLTDRALVAAAAARLRQSTRTDSVTDSNHETEREPDA